MMMASRGFARLVYCQKRILNIPPYGGSLFASMPIPAPLRCQRPLFVGSCESQGTKTAPKATWSRDFFTSSCRNKLHPRSCWKCGGDTNPEKELFFCECGVVQEPARCVTFFELLQMEHTFDIDTSALSKKFKDTQRLLHPDKFSTKAEEEQNFAEEQSSLLNKSYETLLKPLNRAIYLLELEGITISENDSLSDPEFLMSMMEDFEAISCANSPDDVSPLERNNEIRIENCVLDLSKAFSHGELTNAKNLTIQLRYFTTIRERIKEFRMKFLI